MNAQITEMAKRFMVETYGPPDTIDRLNWEAKLRTVLLALEFAEKEREKEYRERRTYGNAMMRRVEKEMNEGKP